MRSYFFMFVFCMVLCACHVEDWRGDDGHGCVQQTSTAVRGNTKDTTTTMTMRMTMRMRMTASKENERISSAVHLVFVCLFLTFVSWFFIIIIIFVFYRKVHTVRIE